MRRVLASAFLAFLIVAGHAEPGLAAPGSQFRVARADVQPVLAQVSASTEGEILEVGRGWFVLRDARGQRCYRWPEGCPVFANGRPSCLATIRPVAPGACFWARLWCDRNGNPAALEAVYCGGELVVLSLAAAGLTGLSPETGELVSLAVAGRCPADRLIPGQLIYVLLDLEGRIRWAFLLRQETTPITSK